MADKIPGAENSWSFQLQLQESSGSKADVKNKQNIWKPQVCPPFCCCSSFLSSHRVPPSNRFDFMNRCSLLQGTHCAFLEPRPRPSLLIYRENSFQYLSPWIFFASFFFLWGEKKKISQSGFGGCAPGCSVEVGSLEEIIRKGNCAQREEKSLRYPRWKILLLCLKVHARRATLLECLNINSSAG